MKNQPTKEDFGVDAPLHQPSSDCLDRAQFAERKNFLKDDKALPVPTRYKQLLEEAGKRIDAVAEEKREVIPDEPEA